MHLFYIEKLLKILAILISIPIVNAIEDPLPTSFNHSTSSSCKEMLDSFAYITSNFTYCAIRHARPITLCRDCVTSYLDVKKIYFDILEIEDMGGDLCRDQLTNLDRLQVVGSGFDYVDQLWSRAYCNSCFTFDHGKPRLTDEVATLLNVSSSLDQCIETYHNASSTTPDNITCSNCEQYYITLNDIYNKMKADSGDITFCMDIIDMMNTTRYTWSKVLACCSNRKKPEKTFMSITGGILIASFLFYVMAFTFTRKAEHDIMPQKRWKEKFTKRPSVTSAIST